MRFKRIVAFSFALLFSAGLLADAQSDGADGLDGIPSRTALPPLVVAGPTKATGLEAYTLREVERVMREQLDTSIEAQDADSTSATPVKNTIVIGTAKNNPAIKQLIADGFVEAEPHREGYALRCAPHPRDPAVWLLAIAGADSRGALYGLRDLEHYELEHFSIKQGRLAAEPFTRRDYPRIEYRGHWVWGCNMPDKKAWLENMSRWKLNEWIEWDNFPPEKAKEYVDFAHERGIRVIWGFGWGWNPDWNFEIPPQFDHGKGRGVQMCGSSQFNKDFFKREILRKIREDYAPSGADGIYFQAFTEVPKCECEQCARKSKGRIMLEFVNPIVDSIKKEFPDLWISCGVHANLGRYDELKELDARCNILWENCDSGTSIRGEGEDFGYIYKRLPYGHGFSKTCPADPPYTEESLQAWMQGNASRYRLPGDIETHRGFMAGLQQWGRNFLGTASANKHASVVADHSVFCRRTPFMHVALAEAQWNPDLDTNLTVDALLESLGLKSEVDRRTEARIEVASVRHEAVGKPVALATKYARQYSGGGNKGLTDGRRAAEATPGDPAWQGYEGPDMEAVVDLGEVTAIRAISSGYLHCIGPAVFLPREVEYAISDNGKEFRAVATVRNKVPENSNKVFRGEFTIEALDLDARFVRVRAKSVGVVPDWHPAHGRKAWLFVDEIVVNPAATVK